MNKILIGLVAISLSSTSFAVQSSQQSKKVTKKQISSSIAKKSCLQARKILLKNGWQPFTPNKDDSPLEYQEAIMQKYPDLEYCRATGYGECFGHYKKGGQYLMVTYLAEGGGSFETPYCGTGEFKLANSPF